MKKKRGGHRRQWLKEEYSLDEDQAASVERAMLKEDLRAAFLQGSRSPHLPGQGMLFPLEEDFYAAQQKGGESPGEGECGQDLVGEEETARPDGQ